VALPAEDAWGVEATGGLADDAAPPHAASTAVRARPRKRRLLGRFMPRPCRERLRDR
jgi:hypothetical protein